jgi:hypothetical protein
MIMSFGVKWWEKLVSAILVIIVSGYILGSILFFIDMKSMSKIYIEDNKTYKTELINIKTDLNRIDSMNKEKNKAMNYRFDAFNDSNAEQHKDLNTELKRFEYVVLKGNKEMMRELKELRKIQESVFLVAKK